jgi:hypothetical protein
MKEETCADQSAVKTIKKVAKDLGIEFAEAVVREAVTAAICSCSN